MIKIEAAHIEEMRGIRKLDIDFRKEKFSILGPNGSGKSGVIDAIEFGLTGQIGRLTGRGTRGLSVSEHGPHVDKSKSPDAAFVSLRVFLTDIDKTATITRTISSPQKPKIEPPDDDVVQALAAIADHPEMTLSRREILRFILVEPTKRSEEIQTILKLDDIGHNRNALNAAENKLREAFKTATAQSQACDNALQVHLQIATLRTEEVLEAVNKRREVLGLPTIAELTADTKLDAGLTTAVITPEFNKQSALRDLKSLTDAAAQFPDLARTEAEAIVDDLKKLETDPALLDAFQRRSLIEKGLDLLDGPDCPLCDTPWESEAHLLRHLKAKLEKSEAARKLQESLITNGGAIIRAGVKVIALLTPVQTLAGNQEEKELAQGLGTWMADLGALKAKLTSLEGIAGLKDRLSRGWLGKPNTLLEDLNAFKGKIDLTADQTAKIDAQTFLTTAQIRLSDYREAKRKNKAAGIAQAAAQAAHETYCKVLEDELDALYQEVEKDFSAFYRAINEEDEAKFTAKFTPTKGSLELGVNFYERGLFPPAAYHSEGHQDGMGVCLYLALMKRLFGERFTFALLDDVVMSVDAGHRYQFCKLLKTQFPNTQFVITTHDRLWAEQMKSAGLVTPKTSLAFHSWTIDGGPLVETNEEIWNDIAASLAKGKVPAAAAALRFHLEYVARHLADQLGANPSFRADGNYELGELLPSVLKKMGKFYGKAAATAQSWGKEAEKNAIAERKDKLSTCNGATAVEQWAVNKAVHYNAWANFEKNDFEPVVAAFKELLECFNCNECGWLYATPRGNPDAVRCDCGSINLNLKDKPKHPA